MLFLAIETSCDETAAAVFREDGEVLSNVVTSQNELHERFTGVVPEIAARAHLRNLLPVVSQALEKAGVILADIDIFAVHNQPGLVGALLMGVTAAKTLALTCGKPLIAVNHIASHIYACRMAANRDIWPCVGMVVSGGHSSLFDCTDPLTMRLVGATRDDAAGEAFDKIAVLLGLGFPGGPALEKLARTGDPKAYAFPRAFIHEDRLEFSFSGLKTAVLYSLHGKNRTSSPDPIPDSVRANVAASFQAAVVDVLVSKARQALRQSGYTRLAVGGGVTANETFRRALEAMCRAEGYELWIPPMALCTDNAAMAALAIEKWKRGEFAGDDLDALPGWE